MIFSKKVKEFSEIMIEEHAPYNHHYEVVWILWLCRSLSISLGERATRLVAQVENSFSACMLLMLRSRGLLTGRGAISDWIRTVNCEDLSGEHWMLIYEASRRKKWRLPGAEAAVNDHPHFRVLRDQNISFFDARAHNMPLKLPRIEFYLRKSLNNRRSALLPGAIFFESRIPHDKREYEKLGEDYGSDEVPYFDFCNDDFSYHNEDGEDIF